eukprot:3716605-Ditylum_brightwellii.AAC.1
MCRKILHHPWAMEPMWYKNKWKSATRSNTWQMLRCQTTMINLTQANLLNTCQAAWKSHRKKSVN